MTEESKDFILYLDDEEPNLMTFQYSLEKYYPIQLANNAAKAIEILESHQIKVMIIDQRMPDITGLEFIAKVKIKYPDIIPIILTAHADLDLTLEAINQGGIFQFLTKPWEINNLRNTINNAIEKYDLQLRNINLLQELQEKNVDLEMSNEELLATTEVLKDHEDKFRILFENANDAIFLIKDGLFVDCNKRTMEMFGCTKSEIIGKSPIDFSPEYQPGKEKSEDLVLIKIKSALEGEQIAFEWQHKQLNGNLFDADISLNVITLYNEIYLQAIVRDITHKKKAEKELKESNKRKYFLANTAIELAELKTNKEIYEYVAKTLFNLTDCECIITVTEFDHQNDEWHMRVVEGFSKMTKDITKILGFDLMKMKGPIKTEDYDKIATGKLTNLDFDIPRLTNDSFSKKIGDALKKLIPFKNLYSIAFKFKKEIFGNITFITKSGTNNFDTKFIESFVSQASLFLSKIITQKELQISEEKYRLLIENGPSVFWITDKNGKTSYISPNVKKVYGFTSEEIYKNGTELWLNRIHKEDLENVLTSFKEVFEKNKRFEVSYRIKNKKGKWIWLHDIGEKFVMENGEEVAYGLFKDITEIKNAENIIKESEERYRQLFDNMTSGFAVHEMIYDDNKNPIDYKYLQINPAFEKLTGVKVKDLLGKTLKDLMPDTEDYWIETYNKVATTGKSITYENYAREIGKYFDAYAFSHKKGQFAVIFNDVTKRKKIEESLKESEERYRQLSDLNHEGIVIHKNGIVLDANKALCNIFGYELNELLGTNVMNNLLTPESRKKAIQNIQEENTGVYTLEGKKKDGSIVFVELEGREVKYKGQNTRVVAIRDITEKIERDRELKESQERFRTVVTNSIPIIFMYDLKGNILLSEGKMLSIFGLKPGEAVGSNVFDNYKEYPEIIEALKRPLKGETFEGIVEFEDFSFDSFYSPNRDSKGNIIGAIGITMDITERKLAAEALKASEERFRTIIEQAADAVYVANLKGEIVNVNNKSCELLGYTKEEFLNKNITDLDANYPKLTDIKNIWNKFSTQKSVTIKGRHIKKDGTMLPVEINNSIIIFNGKKHILGFARDITEREIAEQIANTRLNLLEYANDCSLNELLIKTLDEAEKMTESKISFFHFFHEDQNTITLQAWSTNTMKNMCDAKNSGQHFPVSEAGVWSDSILQKKTVIHNNYEALEHKKGLHEGHTKIIRELVVPIIRQNKIIAIIGVGNKPFDYDKTDVSKIEQLADFAWDIAERKEAQQELLKSEEEMRALLNATIESVFLCNIDGTILTANIIGAERMNQKVDEIVGKNMFSFFPQDVGEKRKKLGDQISKTKKAIRFQDEREGKHFDTSIYPILDKKRNVTSYAIYSKDITDKIKAENTLKESEEKFRNIFNSSTDGILISDEKNQIITFNQTLTDLLGFNKEEAENKEIFNYILPKYIPLIKERRKTLFQNKPIKPAELEIFHKTGKIVPVEVNSKLINYENKKNILSLFRDITERKEAERKILNAIIRTEEQERERFAADLHDDIGPLLSSIKLLVNVLHDTKDTKEKENILNKSYEVINSAIASTHEISNNLSPHLLNNFGLDAALKSFCNKVNVGKKIEIEYESNLSDIKFNKDQEVTVYRIFIELINNTIKHAKAKQVKIDLNYMESKLICYYKDDGIGFNVDQKLKTLNKGLGLNNIINRIKGLNGKYKIESTKGKGMQVTVQIGIEKE